MVKFDPNMTSSFYVPLIDKCKSKEEAQQYFTDMINYLCKEYPDQPREEHIRIQLSNLGYFAGYYDKKTYNRILKWFNTSHPIFGKNYGIQ